MTRVKICGIREKVHALAASEAGADFMGVVFAPSPRQVTPIQAQEMVIAIKGQDNTIEVVGLFVNTPVPIVNRIAQSCNLDWVQLSGDESWAYCQQISKPIIKAVRIREKEQLQQIYDYLDTGATVLSNQRHLYLLDSHVDGKYGGTGMTFDWNLARQIAERFPVIIAGGLTPKNVTQAIEIAAPWGVDTSSGVETNGVKDIAKIRAFVEAVRSADERKN